MRRRGIRMTQEELNATAQRGPHPRQNATVRQHIDEGWLVYRIETRGDTTIVCMQRGSMFGVMYPSGRLIRPLVGKKTVEFSWADARASASLGVTQTT